MKQDNQVQEWGAGFFRIVGASLVVVAGSTTSVQAGVTGVRPAPSAAEPAAQTAANQTAVTQSAPHAAAEPTSPHQQDPRHSADATQADPEIEVVSSDEELLQVVEEELQTPKEEISVAGALFCKYKPNYFVFGVYGSESDGADALPTTRFQVSVRHSLASFCNGGSSGCNPVPGSNHVFFGYTMKSLWALYDSSAPFQEINHNPELFWSRQLRRRWAGIREYQVGFEHESNGEGGDTSRSWNRLYLQPTFNWFFDIWFNDIRLIPKVWWVTPLQYPEDGDGIMRALGAGKITFEIAQRRRGSTAGEQNGWALDVTAGVGTSFDRGFVEAGFAYDPPIKFVPALYVQAFHGYGETLARSLINNTQARAGFRLMEY